MIQYMIMSLWMLFTEITLRFANFKICKSALNSPSEKCVLCTLTITTHRRYSVFRAWSSGKYSNNIDHKGIFPYCSTLNENWKNRYKHTFYRYKMLFSFQSLFFFPLIFCQFNSSCLVFRSNRWTGGERGGGISLLSVFERLGFGEFLLVKISTNWLWTVNFFNSQQNANSKCACNNKWEISK